ncbi:perlucin-like protein [Patiria miniata]|uniref:C-type lectin domain-containing protein n=1 Tax=Patiria miniata TaxID=46514 RepID=A0A914BGI3_PATMI|nr:perlucin-like protein [Patiria miniata]
MAGILMKVGLILLILSPKWSLFVYMQATGKFAHRCETLQVGACPEGWTARGNHCYKTLDGIHSYAAATTTACTDIGGWLPTPNTPEENAFILSMSVPTAEGVWLNCNDLETEGAWTCLDGGKQVRDRYWGTGEPNNAAGNENCAVIEHNDGRWHDVYCNYKHYSVVCKRSAPGVLSIEA